MANEFRGEFLIELDGAPHTMRPSFEAIVEFETMLGKSLINLARASTTGDLTIRDMATIAAVSIREYGKQNKNRGHLGVSDEGVTRCIAELGAMHALQAIQPMLLLAVTGGVTSQGEAKPVPTSETTAEPEADGVA